MMRLLLAFLLVCGLALPAIAAPLHCAALPDRSAIEGHHAGHGSHHDKSEGQPAGKALASQDCLGCATLKAPSPAGDKIEPPAGALRVRPRLVALAGRSAAPDTPPPRPLT